MRMFGYIVCAAVVIGLVAVGCGKTETPPPDVEAIAQKICPVEGNPINKDFFAEHEERKIYFCCAACIETFKNDPGKYIKKVDEDLKKVVPPVD